MVGPGLRARPSCKSSGPPPEHLAAGRLPRGRASSGEMAAVPPPVSPHKAVKRGFLGPRLPQEMLVSAPSRVCDWLPRGASALFTLWAT